MTTYAGDKIHLAPDAATYETTVTRTQTGTQGVYTITLSGTFTATQKITIDGTEVTTGSTTNSTIASTVATAMAANTNYTVTASGSVITLTEKAGHYGIGMPAFSTNSTNGKLTGATTTEGVSTEAVVNSPETFVDKRGVLHASKKLKAGDSITITAKCTYINPSGETSALSDTIVVAVA